MGTPPPLTDKNCKGGFDIAPNTLMIFEQNMSHRGQTHLNITTGREGLYWETYCPGRGGSKKLGYVDSWRRCSQLCSQAS